MNSFIYKTFCAFSGYIHTDYGISFVSLSQIIALSSLSSIIALFINHKFIKYGTNKVYFFIETCFVFGLTLLFIPYLLNQYLNVNNTYLNVVLITIGLSLNYIALQIHWGFTNTVIAHFVPIIPQPARTKGAKKSKSVSSLLKDIEKVNHHNNDKKHGYQQIDDKQNFNDKKPSHAPNIKAYKSQPQIIVGTTRIDEENKRREAKRNRFTTIYNSNWTVATFLFLIAGVLIHLLSFWWFVLIMIAFGVLLSVLNLTLLPKESSMNVGEIHSNIMDSGDTHLDITIDNNNTSINNKTENVKHSIFHDFRILCSSWQYICMVGASYVLFFFFFVVFCLWCKICARIIKIFVFVILTVIISFFVWAMWYMCFGPWLQQVFELNPAELGIITTVDEGIGDLIAILILTYVVKPDPKYKIFAIEYMLLVFLVMEGLACFLIALQGETYSNSENKIESDFSKLCNSYFFVNFLTAFFFAGNEGLIVGLIVLNSKIVAKDQIARASGVMTLVSSVMSFFGQAIGGEIYDRHGMGFLANILTLLCLAIMLFLVSLIIAGNRMTQGTDDVLNSSSSSSTSTSANWSSKSSKSSKSATDDTLENNGNKKNYHNGKKRKLFGRKSRDSQDITGVPTDRTALLGNGKGSIQNYNNMN